MTKKKERSFVLIMILYLAGIFMGAIDTGIVTPARTIIQTSLGVDAQTGIWMITIYTLAYAASIPIMGKLADRFGRKYVYLCSILLFGGGSLLCGLSEHFGSFTFLILARAVQAIGGGGILPIATAEFGTTFPPEKRGMALGLVGGVYGVANIFGASAGSAILDFFGTQNWQFIFYINVPIALFILAAGFFALPNHKAETAGQIDVFGILVLTVMILSLLYGLKNTDFFDLAASVTSAKVYPFLLLFLLLIPVFMLIESRAADPVMNLGYFKNRNLLVSFVIAFISGIVMMGMIFVPQFSENALRIPTGSGGYMVIILGLFAGVSAPVSGRFIDKAGARAVLSVGFAVSIIGALFLVFVTTAQPNFVTVMVSLILIGVGIGFTMGTPINYMVLANTRDSESNSAIATVSLIRSIGTAIAPAIMVGFISHAGMGVQADVMALLPTEVKVPPLPYMQDITEELATLKSDPNMADQFANMTLPDFASMETVEIKMDGNSDVKVPEELTTLMQSSDVTTITANTKTFASTMFAEMTPTVISDIHGGIQKGVSGIDTGSTQLQGAIVQMQEGYDGIGQGIDGMNQGIAAQKQAKAQLDSALTMLSAFKGGNLPEGMTVASLIPESVRGQIPQSVVTELEGVTTLDQLKGKIAELDAAIGVMETRSAQMSQLSQSIAKMGGIPAGKTAADVLPPPVLAKMPGSVVAQLEKITTQEELDAAIQGMNSAIAAQKEAKSQLESVAAMLEELGNGRFPATMKLTDMLPASAKSSMPADVLAQLENVTTVAQLEEMDAQLQTAIDTLTAKVGEAQQSRQDMADAMASMESAVTDMSDLKTKVTTLDSAVPGAFDTARDDYLKAIDDRSAQIETVFQNDLNRGFRNVYLTAAIAAMAGLIILQFYSKKQELDGTQSEG